MLTISNGVANRIIVTTVKGIFIDRENKEACIAIIG